MCSLPAGGTRQLEAVGDLELPGRDCWEYALYEVDFCTLYGNMLGRGLSPKDQQQDTCNALRAPV